MIASVTDSPRKSSAAAFKSLQNNARKFGRTVAAALNSNASVAILRVDDLERRCLSHALNFRRIKLSANQTFDGVDSIGRIRHSLPFGNLANEPFAFIGEPNHTRRRSTTLLCLGRSAPRHLQEQRRSSLSFPNLCLLLFPSNSEFPLVTL